ncbi:hypothetical protein PIB30_079669 [Stylosanthes scabra]|uniref:Replication factor A C-terminal domain-containing protein n=1 Tax=Stylosanthes scabra TaxID=79078 RepID=A0ABU6XQ41_9FABA|nr:hypothetical protein [Stylosanthes scabra]
MSRITNNVSSHLQECQPWITVKFEALNVRSNDWCYSARDGCKKKVDTRDGTSSEAKHCSKDTGARVDRYKIEVIATNDTGCINLLLWDREAKLLCGKPAEEVKKEKLEGDDNYPKTLNNMLDRKLLIRIHVRSSNITDGDPVYPVIKVIHDEEVIGRCTPLKDPMKGQVAVDPGNATSLSTENLSNAVNLISDSDPHYSVVRLLSII